MTDERFCAAYQGEPGAFSEQAAWVLIGADVPLLPCPTLPDVFEAVTNGRAREAVIPVENTLAGTVPRAYELILEHGLTVRAEARVHIDHMLLAHPSAEMNDVRRVLSHPVALDQCRTFIKSHRLEAVPVFDTAGAVGVVMQGGGRETAAIASRRAGDLHGAAVLAEHIQDHEENWTRFLRLAHPATGRATSGRKAIVVFELPHEPGSLSRALERFASYGLNLTKIESRPIPGRPFEYSFLVEMICAERAPRWAEWLAAVQPAISRARLVGTFDPAAPSPSAEQRGKLTERHMSL